MTLSVGVNPCQEKDIDDANYMATRPAKIVFYPSFPSQALNRLKGIGSDGRKVIFTISQGLKVCAYGKVTYRELSGTSHVTLFCAFANPDSGTADACPYYNWMN